MTSLVRVEDLTAGVYVFFNFRFIQLYERLFALSEEINREVVAFYIDPPRPEDATNWYRRHVTFTVGEIALRLTEEIQN